MEDTGQGVGRSFLISHTSKGPKNGGQALGVLQKFAYYTVDKDAEGTILDSAFRIVREDGQTEFVLVSVEDLGLVQANVWDESIWYYGRICDKARELGLGMCTPNDVIQIAVQGKNFIADREGFIIPAMDPIVNARGRFGILGLRLDKKEGKNFIIRGFVGHPRSSLKWYKPTFVFRRQPHPTFVQEKRVMQVQSEATRTRADEISVARTKLKELDDFLRSQLTNLRRKCAHNNGGNGGGAWGAGFCVDCGCDLDDGQW